MTGEPEVMVRTIVAAEASDSPEATCNVRRKRPDSSTDIPSAVQPHSTGSFPRPVC